MSNISDAKEIADLIRKLDNTDLYRKIIDLQSEIVDLASENNSLKQRVGELEESLRIREKLKWNKPFYYIQGDDTPICPRCWESANLAIHLKYMGEFVLGHRWDCPDCQNKFYKKQSSNF